MAMTPTRGDGKIVAPVMNVTPLVDVVLVLLILVMVITPLLAKRFWLHVPKQEQQEVDTPKADADETPLVLHLNADRTLNLNGQTVDLAELVDRLKRMFAARTDHVLFFDPDDGVPIKLALEVLDLAREGGAVTIATLTKPLTQPDEPPAVPHANP